MPTPELPGLEEFLQQYPLMARRPATGNEVILKGQFAFSAETAMHGEISESYRLTIQVPQNFPRELPVVVETGGRIPRRADFHLNSGGALCLGSPLRLLSELSKRPTLTGFAEALLVPYLFAITRKLQFGGGLVFDELAHGQAGLLADYAELFVLNEPGQVLNALKLLGMKKRIANKYQCPCGCKVRLGKCNFNRRIAQFRRMASCSWFKKQHKAALPIPASRTAAA